MIYVSALDWGYGHLSRTCAVIKRLYQNNDIVIFSTENQSRFYKQTFPNLPQVLIPSYDINFYPESFLKNLFQLLKLFKSIQKENIFLQQYIQNNQKPDLIISDNRYGFRYNDVKNIIICHQIEMQVPKAYQWINYIHQNLLNKFNEIWIPDYANESISLAGKLSHPTECNISVHKLKYIPPHSLMKKYDFKQEIDYLFIISGTQPERMYFEKLFLNFAKNLLKKNQDSKISIIGSIQQDNNLLLGWKNFEQTNQLLVQAKNIVTRAGYTTLMDMHSILTKKQNLYLVSSKSQYEQIYLYNYWISKNLAKPLSKLKT